MFKRHDFCTLTLQFYLICICTAGKVGLALAAFAVGGAVAALNKVALLEDTDYTLHHFTPTHGNIGFEHKYYGRRSTTPGAWTAVAKEPTDY